MGSPRRVCPIAEPGAHSYRYGRSRNTTFHAAISLAVDEDELVRRLLERGRQSGRADDNEVTGAFLEQEQLLADARIPTLGAAAARLALCQMSRAGAPPAHILRSRW